MNDYVIIYDTTLRDGEQAPGFRMNFSQKLEVAKSLEMLGVDVIEAGFPASSKGDFSSVYNISKEIRGPFISALARCVKEDISSAGEALLPAIDRGKGKIHVFIATSQIHRDKKLKKTKEEVKQMAIRGVREAKRFTPYVEFSCEDFARTDIDYTIEIVNEAINAGATTVNLPDTVGYRFPTEIKEMFEEVIERVNRDDIIFSIHAHNDLGMSVANSLYAILGGARQVEVTINGIGERAGNCALEEVVAGLIERPEFFKRLKTRINSELIVPTSRIVSRITGKSPQLNKAITGGNAFRHSSGIHSHGFLEDEKTYGWIDARRYGGKSELPLTARSGRHQLEAILKEKRIWYDPLKVNDIMVRFKDMADNLGEIYDNILVMAVRGDNEIPEYYKILEFDTSFKESGYASIRMMVGEKEFSVSSKGNGMINATENAINKITNIPLEIVDYSSQSLTKGGKSKGIESVIVRNNGYIVRGVGISDDTVYGAAKALVDANNQMKYVLENRGRS
jgi:2-isopropylmalate synthase